MVPHFGMIVEMAQKLNWHVCCLISTLVAKKQQTKPRLYRGPVTF
jgi:hypothetical protein